MARDDSQIAVAYYYCSFDEAASQDPIYMVGSFISQISTLCPDVLEGLEAGFARRERPTLDDLEQHLVHHTSRSSLKTLILVDAVNECKKVEPMTKVLLRLAKSASDIRVLFTSTEECNSLARLIYRLLPEFPLYYFRVSSAISAFSMASARYDSGLEPGYDWADAALGLPKPVKPCSICQRLVDFLNSSCTGEEPDSDSGSDTLSACVLATWSAIQQNDGCPTCQKVIKTLSRLDASDSCTEYAHIGVNEPWEGSFTIKLRRDCQDEDKDIGFLLSPLGDDTPWAGYLSGVLVDASWVDIGRIEKWFTRCNSLHNG